MSWEKTISGSSRTWKQTARSSSPVGPALTLSAPIRRRSWATRSSCGGTDPAHRRGCRRNAWTGESTIRSGCAAIAPGLRSGPSDAVVDGDGEALHTGSARRPHSCAGGLRRPDSPSIVDPLSTPSTSDSVVAPPACDEGAVRYELSVTTRASSGCFDRMRSTPSCSCVPLLVQHRSGGLWILNSRALAAIEVDLVCRCPLRTRCRGRQSAAPGAWTISSVPEPPCLRWVEIGAELRRLPEVTRRSRTHRDERRRLDAPARASTAQWLMGPLGSSSRVRRGGRRGQVHPR